MGPSRTEYSKKYYLEHKDEMSEKARLYRLENKDKIKENKDRYYLAHRDEQKEKSLLYRLAHKEELRLHELARKDKHNEQTRLYRLAHKDAIKEKRRCQRLVNREQLLAKEASYREKYWVRYRVFSGKSISKINGYAFAVDADEAEKAWIGQNGRCAFCTTTISSKTAVLDHNHETGEFRAWLCNSCNTLEGQIGAWIKRTGANEDKFTDFMITLASNYFNSSNKTSPIAESA